MATPKLLGSFTLKACSLIPSSLPLICTSQTCNSQNKNTLKDTSTYKVRKGKKRRKNNVPTSSLVSRTNNVTEAHYFLMNPQAKSRNYDVEAVITVRNEPTTTIVEKIRQLLDPSSRSNSACSGVTLQLVSTEVDPHLDTMEPMLSKEALLVFSKKSMVVNHSYKVKFVLNSNFGVPGAIILTNNLEKEFYLEDISIEGHTRFACKSWIQPFRVSSDRRVFFSDKVYLPSQTPLGLKELRDEELRALRGNRNRARLASDRIYDYDVYNDLGNPDKGIDLKRPTFGGHKFPHPRRCQTGRPSTTTDVNAEIPASASIPAYVPRDETFEEAKDTALSEQILIGTLRNVIPSLVSWMHHENVSQEILGHLYKRHYVSHHKSYQNNFPIGLLEKLLKNQDIVEKFIKFDPPKNSPKDGFWGLRDDEFGRSVVAGVNPLSIQSLKVFPPLSKLDPSIYGQQESALKEEHLIGFLDGMSVQEALDKNRLFILDYHDVYIPFLDRINSVEGRNSYATRTVFFLTQLGTLKPIAIELSLPPTEQRQLRTQVLTPPIDATSNWLWQLGKAHVCSNDVCVNQLVNHWLRTHAVLEPFIIAAHRQMSVMHPVLKLLHPHMRYTLKINTMARETLINAEGNIETFFTPGRYSMEIVSSAYREWWRLDLEGLPNDLIRRGMAEPDATQPHGLRLMIEDYPYANDGLLIWSAIENLVQTYVSYYYSDEDQVEKDTELQSWYSEAIKIGHADICNAPWWPSLSTPEDLIQILTTMIWLSSAHHAAVNFGQYSYGGFIPNRPPLIRRLLPQESDPEYTNFLADPQEYFLASLPSLSESAKIMAILDTLSMHSPDEEYIGERKDLSSWSSDPKIMDAFYKFSVEIKMIEKEIEKRNSDPKLRNRCGPGTSPYELLIPSSKPGNTCRGVPMSISL